MLRLHQVRMPDAVDREIREAFFVGENPYRTPTQLLQPAIPGVQVFPGYRCHHCAYYCKDVVTIRRHHDEKHTGLVEASDPCMVQNVVVPPKKRFVGVLVEDTMADAVDDRGAFSTVRQLMDESMALAGPVANLPGQAPQVYRVMNT